MDNRKAVFNLFLISFLSLFGEMAFIRYLSSGIYLLSCCKNAVLIAIFLGLGTGFLLAKKKTNLIGYLPVPTLILLCVIIYSDDYLRIDLDYGSRDGTIWPEFWANSRAREVPIFGVLMFFYVAISLYFIPIGQETGRAMSRFSTLKAYTINTAASLAGIILFSAAVVFAVPFSSSERFEADLGSNIFGAALGGMSEYASMVTGFNALYILSLLAYPAAFACGLRGRR